MGICRKQEQYQAIRAFPYFKIFCVFLQFEPRSGPIQGGTRVTIHGHNFGTSDQNDPNVSVQVIVALVDCVIEDRNSSRYVCRYTRNLESNFPF